MCTSFKMMVEMVNFRHSRHDGNFHYFAGDSDIRAIITIICNKSAKMARNSNQWGKLTKFHYFDHGKSLKFVEQWRLVKIHCQAFSSYPIAWHPSRHRIFYARWKHENVVPRVRKKGNCSHNCPNPNEI